MNIGLVIYGSLDIVTGGFIYDRKLVEFLRKNRDRVEVFAFPWRTYPSHILQNFSYKILSWAQNQELDVLLEDELNHPSLFLVNKRLKQTLSCPIVAIVHHLRSCEMRPNWQNLAYGVVERYFLKGVDAYIFPSSTTANSVELLVGNHKPFVVANPGKDAFQASVSIDDVRRKIFSGGPLKILFVGNLIPRKGLHVVIEGLKLLPPDQWRLKVVGSLSSDRRYAGLIRRKINEHGLESNIDLLGTVTGVELSDLYRSSHVLAVPSSYEGFGIVYVEAMGFGLPSIASTSGAAGEIISHGVNGYLIDPEDYRSVAEHLHGLIIDRHKLFSMALAATERYERYPTWNQTGHKIRSFLEALISNRVGRVSTSGTDTGKG